MEKAQIGLIGLGVMGKNLVLNLEEKGYRVAVFNRTQEKTRQFKDQNSQKRLNATFTLEEFVESLQTPRKIILMLKAGAPIDDAINLLIPLLESGDLIMDGGNSNYMHTKKRLELLKKHDINYLGVGISGGEEGARNGPALMPGGGEDAYKMVEQMLTDISAKAYGEPCCAYLGNDGAGHFVKTVHNGIEYADMQLIAEAYTILKKVIGFSDFEIHQTFKGWRKSELESYLIDITAEIFKEKDNKTDDYLINKILDVAGQKGTGKWSSEIALDIGVSTPTITEAVFFRYMSNAKQEREFASKVLKSPSFEATYDKSMINVLKRALYAAKICAYAQGFSLMLKASKNFGWGINLADVAKVFRGGCIIRAKFLNNIKDAFEKKPCLENILLDDYFLKVLDEYQNDLRKIICACINQGVTIPGFSSAISYFDAYRTNDLPTNLIQAQRDYFGSHTYQRVDEEGFFHTKWGEAQ